ncbi:hypothetical protein [Caminibacter pacificus]|uniref:Uncharacterized protein n=1 Tax=Caminibacter pacificus TaxID=1424653 RepID=A0AAJ4RAQ6_9BACT|nr:hypothetical protein [Caminibacter pacificus]QDD68163.1 hypothetical protein C6V80_09930 [Caminibacter pacificus]ROR38782.1 hypothetical protein EDC58_1997 [Caminibacter pacificus]
MTLNEIFKNFQIDENKKVTGILRELFPFIEEAKKYYELKNIYDFLKTEKGLDTTFKNFKTTLSRIKKEKEKKHPYETEEFFVIRVKNPEFKKELEKLITKFKKE